MSTPSFSAWALAKAPALTLNAIMIAFETCAKVTSVSVTPPTLEWITETLTSSFESLTNDCFKASTEPWTSALTIKVNCFKFSVAILENTSS